MQKPAPAPFVAALLGRRAAESMHCAQAVSALFALLAVLGLLAYHPSVHAQSPLNNATRVSAGGFHTCALTASGGVKCWGLNGSGQLGDGSTTDRLIAIDVSGLSSGLSAIATGGSHTCALTASGGVKCWGLNGNGQLGDGSTTQQLTAVDVSGLSSGVSAIATGQNHTCALTASGGVKCWGLNSSGQLGDGSSTQRLTAVDVSGLGSGVSAIAAGVSHTCALTAGGGVKCWGRNANGQLGDGSTIPRLTAVDVSGLGSGVSAIATGGSHSCALTASGGVKCWGLNANGQLGDGSTTQQLTAVDVSGLSSGVSAVAAGFAYTCAVTASGGAKCWGLNSSGQLGDGSTTQRLTAVDVSGLGSGVSAIATRGSHTCALTTGGGVKCWGNNAAGQLGDGSLPQRLIAVDVIGLSGIGAIATGGAHTCALTSVGGVKCWGNNPNGQLGDGSNTPRLTAVDVGGLSSGVSAIATGGSHTCALTASGGVKCWGSNSNGQLGDGSVVDRLTAVDVSGLNSGVGAIAAGDAHTCALTASGGVKCWGLNSSGQLGDGSTTQRLTAVDVSGLSSGVSAIATGGFHTCALTAGGGVKCWGNNQSGQIGDGSVSTVRLTAVDVSGLGSGVSAVATGREHTCARTASGGVKCWGFNGTGQLGDGSTTNQPIAVDVSGLSAGVSAIATGGAHTCALSASGGVKCWGRNGNGQLGDGSTVNRLTAVDVSGLSSGVSAIATGNNHTCALTAGGGVKCWGNNANGQLGIGGRNYGLPGDVLQAISVFPVAVPVTSLWSLILLVLLGGLITVQVVRRN